MNRLPSLATGNALAADPPHSRPDRHALKRSPTCAVRRYIAGITSNVSSVKGKFEVQLDKIEKAFDSRVASALNRLGIPSKQDVEVLSAKLDQLSALLDHVARTK